MMWNRNESAGNACETSPSRGFSSALAVLFFIVTIVRLGGNVANRAM